MKSTGLKLAFAAATLAGLVTSFAASADDSSWGSLGGTLAVTSDYRYRGISQSNRKVAPQGSLTWTGPDGWYAGTWLSTTDWTSPLPKTPSFEEDIYAGKHFDLDGTDLNIEAYYYSYPDAQKAILGPAIASYYETIVQLAHTFGPLALTATGAMSPQWSLGGGTAWYVEGTAAYTVNDWLSLSGNVGHQWVKLAPTDYTHYDVGATLTWKSLSLDGRYYGTDLSKINCGYYMGTKNACSGSFVGLLTYTFTLLP